MAHVTLVPRRPRVITSVSGLFHRTLENKSRVIHSSRIGQQRKASTSSPVRMMNYEFFMTKEWTLLYYFLSCPCRTTVLPLTFRRQCVKWSAVDKWFLMGKRAADISWASLLFNGSESLHFFDTLFNFVVRREVVNESVRRWILIILFFYLTKNGERGPLTSATTLKLCTGGKPASNTQQFIDILSLSTPKFKPGGKSPIRTRRKSSKWTTQRFDGHTTYFYLPMFSWNLSRGGQIEEVSMKRKLGGNQSTFRWRE